MDPNKVNAIAPVIRGSQYRQTHRASVIGILGAGAPKVSSRGSRFFNSDRWTTRIFTTEMCKWAQENPECIPTEKNIQRWINKANETQVERPEIVIANTPDELPLRVALALTGGAYHEAWHTLYSERGDLSLDKMMALVLPRWALVKDWSKYHEALQDWSNIIEDIRIERLGRLQFSGTYVKMCDLQDFILDMELQGQQNLRSHGGKPKALSVIIGTFRDLGLGYNTEKQRAALDRYIKDNPKAVLLVRNGPLSPLLREAIDLSKEDSSGCLRLAMEVIATLAENSPEKKNPPGQTGKNGKSGCLSCGASASKIIIRPKSDGNGGKVPGVGIATCTICGHQEEIPIITKPPEETPDQDPELPKIEGFSDPTGGEAKTDTTEGQKEDWSDVVNEALQQASSGEGTGLKDAGEALAEALKSEMGKEDRDTHHNEAPWCPYDPGLDSASLVRPSKHGQEHDLAQAEEILRDMQEETRFLRARLRNVIRSLEMTSVTHGVIKGSRLSSRFLVDTRVALLGKETPKRAYDQPGLQIDMSFAVVVVVDESGSMNSRKREVSKIFCAVTEPFDGLGCATLALGFRDSVGALAKDRGGPDKVGCHRSGGVHYDIFKNWNERFPTIKWRFANTRALGGTPMADGIQFAIDAVSKRDEPNRVIFVVTDGNPNPGHAPVIRRQIRLAREAGVYIVGIGLGEGSKNVLTLFDDSIWSEDLKELPKLILDKLNKIVDVGGTKRGCRVKRA